MNKELNENAIKEEDLVENKTSFNYMDVFKTSISLNEPKNENGMIIRSGEITVDFDYAAFIKLIVDTLDSEIDKAKESLHLFELMGKIGPLSPIAESDIRRLNENLAYHIVSLNGFRSHAYSVYEAALCTETEKTE